MIREDLLNEIRSKTDIVDVVQRYLPLVKKGKNYFALCPFHDDHDPSLSISQDKQIYKCFVCGAGGNVFQFVKEFEKIHFNEAVLKVAEFINFDVGSENIQKPRTIDPKTQGYYDALNEYVRYVRYALNTPQAKEVKAYLKKRGLHDETLEKFDVGFNPPDDAASTYLQAKNHTLETLVKVNVVRTNEFGNRDVFQHRVIFPIHNAQGQVVGFTARALSADAGAKYINTTETPLYIKGQILYNYHRALRSIKEKRQVILVEGVMDALALDQSGYDNVVASLGTALTKEHVRLLRSAASQVVLCYDADEAGQTAMFKLGKLLQSQSFSVSVVLNQSGQDLDELALSDVEKLKKLVNTPVHLVEFMIEYHLKRFNLNNYSERKTFASLMMDELSEMNDAFDQAMIMERLERLTQFSQAQLKLLIQPKKTPAPIQRTTPLRLKPAQLKDWPEKEILAQMLMSKQAMIDFRDGLGYFNDATYQALALRILHHYRKHDKLVVADFLNTLDQSILVELVSELVNSDIYFHAYAPEALQDAILQVKINTLEAEIFAFKQKHKEDLALSHDVSIVTRYQELLHQRRQLQLMKGQTHHA
jgi:DNA primase